jgi:hypothetical protein
MHLDAATAREWVAHRLGFAPRSVRALTGGVSSIVLLAEGERRVVVKQALPRLQVEAEWLCDPARALREAAALRALGPLLPPGSIPELLAEDADLLAFAMSAAPAESETWKAKLLRGECSIETARTVGEILAACIGRTADLQSSDFDDMSIFDDLRLDAYYRFTAARHPDLRAYYQELIQDCVRHRRCLVHGDFSPKNILTDGREAMVIDWECVHYGNPAFDAAFLLNHLLLKSFHRPGSTAGYQSLAVAFWHAVEPAAEERLREATLRHWPGLLLARVDGKSPVEYIRDPQTKDCIRELARDLIVRPPASVPDVFARRLSYKQEECR